MTLFVICLILLIIAIIALLAGSKQVAQFGACGAAACAAIIGINALLAWPVFWAAAHLVSLLFFAGFIWFGFLMAWAVLGASLAGMVASFFN